MRVFTLDDGQGTRLQVSDWGASLLSCQVLAGDGQPREVLLGHQDPADYQSEPGYLGAVVGRYANRIGGAQFELDGQRFALAANEGVNQLHGGPVGFDKRSWDLVQLDARHLTLELVSADGDQGFPGQLTAQVTYAIEAPGVIAMRFEATTTAACPVNLSSHAYFNLDREHIDCRQHRIALRASRYLPVDAALIPTGLLADVGATAFDLRLDQGIDQHGFDHADLQASHGYDHCFVLDPLEVGEAAATICASDGLLRLRLHTDYPALQFYTGFFLPRTRDRQGQPFAAHAGFALEAQLLPDAPTHPEWPTPSCLLRPGETYRRHTTLRFDAPKS